MFEGTVRPDLIALAPEIPDLPLALQCEYVTIADWVRIYFRPNESEGNGFYAVVIEIAGTSTDKPWEEDFEHTNACVVGYCIAYFDGIRHLYLGEDGKGYLFHPEMQDWLRIVQALHDLEKQYCRDWE